VVSPIVARQRGIRRGTPPPAQLPRRQRQPTGTARTGRPRQDYYLAVIGLVAFTAATIGYEHRRRHRPGDTPHIVGMGLSYTAMLTALYVDNGPHLPLWDRLPVIACWILPGIVGMLITARALGRTRRKSRRTAKPDSSPATEAKSG
jgi:hypothetical protein